MARSGGSRDGAQETRERRVLEPSEWASLGVLEAARCVLWKLSHNHELPDYSGPARIDRRDASVRWLQAAVDAAERGQ